MGSTLKDRTEDSTTPKTPIITLWYLYPMLLSCFILLTSSATQHCLRGSLAFIFTKVGVHPSELFKFKALMLCNYAPGIFFSLITGQLNDMLGDFTSLIFFTSVSTLGTWCVYFFINFKTPTPFYFIAMLFYGTGQILLRIPMKKFISNFYEGPYLALFLNINHNASHLAGILGGFAMARLLSSYSINGTFLIISVFSSLAVPLCLLLKGKLEKGKSKKTSLKNSLREFFASTEPLFFLIMAGGCFVDGVSVCYKNVETFIFKENVLNATEKEIMEAIAFTKFLNLIGPIISLGIDKFPYRTVYLLISGINVCLIYGVYTFLMYKEIKVSKYILMGISAFYKLNLVFFYSSWYPSLALLVRKHLRGTGFGIVFTFNNFGFAVFQGLYAVMGKNSMLLFLIIAILGTLLFLIGMVKANKEGGKINKKL